jgi:DNA-binding transcriptional LysR family regulator
MDLFDGMKTFVAAVDAGSFTGAADRLGQSPKLVSKYIGKLEDRLGARLFHRTTRRLSLTSAGQRYYARCTQLIEDLEALESDVRDDASGLRGRLRLSAPSTFGELYVTPLARKFRKVHPDLTVDLRLGDRYVDLADEGFDLAIRIGQLDESNMIARRLTRTELWAVAAREYLAQRDIPTSPKDLSKHVCIRDTNLRSGSAWPFAINGQSSKVSVDGPLQVNSAKAVRDLVARGEGIGLCPDYVVGPDVESGDLVRVLADYPSLELDVQVVFLDARYMPTKVRSFLDFLVSEFRQMEGWKSLRD